MKERDPSIPAVDRNGIEVLEHDVLLRIGADKMTKWRVDRVHPNGSFDVVPVSTNRLTVTDASEFCLFERDPALRSKGPLTADDRELLEERVEKHLPETITAPGPKNGNGKPCSRCKAAPRERGAYCIECKRIIMHEYHLKKIKERDEAAEAMGHL